MGVWEAIISVSSLKVLYCRSRYRSVDAIRLRVDARSDYLNIYCVILKKLNIVYRWLKYTIVDNISYFCSLVTLRAYFLSYPTCIASTRRRTV
jgi:hypothetical protein